MEDDGSMEWQKTAFTRRFMTLVIPVGFVIFLVVALFAPFRNGIRSRLLPFVGFVVGLLIIILALRSDRFIPRKFGISREKLRVQYVKKTETYPWAQISRIYSERNPGNTKLVIESVDGQVFRIPFLLKDEREKIIDYFESHQKLEHQL